MAHHARNMRLQVEGCETIAACLEGMSAQALRSGLCPVEEVRRAAFNVVDVAGGADELPHSELPVLAAAYRVLTATALTSGDALRLLQLSLKVQEKWHSASAA